MITKLLFYLFIKPLSYLPLSVLHLLSDVFFVLVYHLIAYRKKLVQDNIRRSFPEKGEKEIRAISKAFFKHFCDVMLESIRMLSMPVEELRQRSHVTNPELFQHYYDQGRNIAITSGHCGNWEWAVVGLGLHIPYQVIAIYKTLSNPFFEKIIKQSRSRFGMELVPKNDFKNYIKTNANQQIAVVFAGDQAPSKRQKVHWMEFLNQETPVMMGAEVYSKRYDYVVLITEIKRIKRGFYQTTFHVVEEQPEQSEMGEITAAHTKILEQQIRETPYNWLWTHRRWKRKRTEMDV